MYAYMGKILKVNLSTSKIEVQYFDEAFARKFHGGNGFVQPSSFSTFLRALLPLMKKIALFWPQAH